MEIDQRGADVSEAAVGAEGVLIGVFAYVGDSEGLAYTGVVQLTIHIPDETAALLQSRGVEIASIAEEAVAREAQSARSRPDPEVVAGAVDRILERRSRLTLDGLKIRDLIDEGRKY